MISLIANGQMFQANIYSFIVATEQLRYSSGFYLKWRTLAMNDLFLTCIDMLEMQSPICELVLFLMSLKKNEMPMQVWLEI